MGCPPAARSVATRFSIHSLARHYAKTPDSRTAHDSLVPVLLHARAEGHFDRTLTISGAVNLDLITGSGDVIIKTGGSNQLMVHATIHSSNDWFSSNEGAIHAVEANPPIEQNGNTVRIGYNLPDDVKRHVSISYEVTVPADTAVQAHSGSGSIQVTGVRSGADVKTGSGDIQLRDIGAGVKAQTGSGTIRAENVSAPLTAHTGSGDIETRLTGQGDVDAQSGSGSIRMQGVKGGLRIHTGSGDVEADGDVKDVASAHRFRRRTYRFRLRQWF